MAKNKNRNQNQNHMPTPSSRPAGPESSTHLEPTSEQIRRLGEAESADAKLTTELGPPPTEGLDVKLETTLENCLKRVEALLKNASGHLANARKLECEQKQIRDNLDDERENLRRLKADVDAKHNEAKKMADEAKQRKDECLAKEVSLTEREMNAEMGFLAEKERILQPLKDEVSRLREERERLHAEIEEGRAKAEDEIRAKAKARAKKWADEDAARTEAEADEWRKFDEALAQERQEKLDALRTLLASEREKAEASWQADIDRRTAALDDRSAELDGREATLKKRQTAQRAAELDLQAAQEMLAEDRAGLDRKVERLVAERTEDLRHEVASLGKQLADARDQRDAYFKDLESRRELDRRFGGCTPEEILSTLTAAERERDTLARQLRERPDACVAERLSELERERSAWLEERSVLLGELAKANGELSLRRESGIELEGLRRQKEALETTNNLLGIALKDLDTKVKELMRQDDRKNELPALTSIDENEALQTPARTTAPYGRSTPTLRDFVDDLRHRIALGVEGRTLYYAERDVRAFLGGLAMTRFMLLQGISGTGKTSLPLAFAHAVGDGDKRGDAIEVIEVQAGWRDRQDLIGYYNAFHRHYYATNFLQALYKAGTPAYRDRPFLIVLDEINLSRPEQFFADFLSALEQPMDARRLTLVNDPVNNAPRLLVGGRHLPIPPNVWFIGTANHDESTAEFADKTYDRAHVMEMPRKTQAAQFDVERRGQRNAISYDKLEAAFRGAAEAQSAAVRKATDWLRGAAFAEDLQRRFRVGWGNRLENQLSRYLPVVVEAGGSVGEAMDHLLTKVLRKLKDRHDVRAPALEKLSTDLLEAWDSLDSANPPEWCVALIDHEIAAKKGEELA